MFWPFVIIGGAVDIAIWASIAWVAFGSPTSGDANYPPDHYSRLQ